MMPRLEEWQEPFFAYIDASRTAAFAWGVHDCCLFAAGAVDVLTGSTLAAQLRLCYTDEASALAYIASFGSLEAAVSSWLGPSRAPNFAGPGDIVIANLELGPTIGVCLGSNCAFSGEVTQYRSRDFIQLCWPI